MKAGQTKQFDTFDNRADRRELVILFEKLGEGLPELIAMQYRAKWLQDLIPHSVSSLSECPLLVTPCNPVEAYHLFVQIVGVLEVPIADAARMLDRAVTRKDWLKRQDASVAFIMDTRFGGP